MVPNAWNYTHLSGAGTTNIFTGIGATQGAAASPMNIGLYGGINVNTAGTTVTVTDGSGGPTVAVIGALSGSFLVPMPGMQLKNGLTVVIAGAADVTVYWQ